MFNIKKELNGRDPENTYLLLEDLYRLPCRRCFYNFSDNENALESLSLHMPLFNINKNAISCYSGLTRGISLTYSRYIKCQLNGGYREDD